MESKPHPSIGTATFRVFRSDTVVAVFGLVLMGSVGAFFTWSALNPAGESEGPMRWFSYLLAALTDVAAVGVPIYMIRRSRREGTIVIDPVKGEIRFGEELEIPFSQVRQVEVVEHEYTYRAVNSQHDTVTSDMTGWAIDLGGGLRLLAKNGLSEKRVTEIADALRERVKAYRAQTNEGIAPMPEPSEGFLKRLAGALKEEGKVFEPNWLERDGPMADEIRAWDREPTEATMGPDGAFARALRKAGYDLGDRG